MPSICVALGENSYPIMVDHNVLGQIGQLLKPKARSDCVVVVADVVVSQLYGGLVLEGLRDAGFNSQLIEVPSGEEQKSLEWFGRLHDTLIDCHMDRTSTLIALGGGVIGDLVGFVAATYMRGISFVQIPTTLQAQVDASVGGKTGINHPKSKNLIGTFHQPQFVLIDVTTLNTLSHRDIRAGLSEVIKHGVIMDSPLFNQVEENLHGILNLDADVLIDVITRSCADKAQIVASDERESRLRMTLNYGHTFGHAVEALTGYSLYRHGEAVAMGMNCAAQLALNLEMLSGEELKRQRNLIRAAGLPVYFPSSLRTNSLIDAMYLDKKTRDGKLTLVLPTSIGSVAIRDDVDDVEIVRAITECISDEEFAPSIG